MKIPSTAELLKIASRRPDGDPNNTQTIDAISSYYRNVKPGDHAVVRETYFGLLRFNLTVIEAIKGPRVYLENAPAWGGQAFYLKSGKNCQSPTGQDHLVVPTQEIINFAAAHPDGKRIGGSIIEFPYRVRFHRN